MPINSLPLTMMWTSTDSTGATASITFNPALAKIVQRSYYPTQRVHVAEAGHLWVYEVSSNVELVLPMEFQDIPTDASDTGVITHGYDDLVSFITTTLVFSRENFSVTDADGHSYFVKYMSGLETFREAEGRSQRAGHWTGTLTLRKVLITV